MFGYTNCQMKGNTWSAVTHVVRKGEKKSAVIKADVKRGEASERTMAN